MSRPSPQPTKGGPVNSQVGFGTRLRSLIDRIYPGSNLEFVRQVELDELQRIEWELLPQALKVLGNCERFRQDATERYPHILDPRSGWPVGHVASVTVIATEGVLADAAATALVVAGLEGWPGVAAALGLEEVLVVDEEGTVFLTPAMQQRVRFTEPLDPVVVDPGSSDP